MDIQGIMAEDMPGARERRRRLTLKERELRRRRRRKRKMIRAAALGMAAMLFCGIMIGIIFLFSFAYRNTVGMETAQMVQTLERESIFGQRKGKWQDFYATDLEHPQLNVSLLTINEFSRPGIPLPEVKNIFIHYTANAGTTAMQNRSYFESLGETQERSASAHFIIDADGEIVQCIPTQEIAYAVMKRNYDSISIECCYEREDGKFTEATYRSLIEMTAWLLHKYQLEPEDVLRHYDEGGKHCPKYYVENEEDWEQLLADLSEYMERAGDT